MCTSLTPSQLLLPQTRAYPRSEEGKRHAVRYGTIDSNVALTMALGVNAGILVVAATAFHYRTDNPTVAGGAAGLATAACAAAGQG